MKILKYAGVKATPFESGGAKGVTGRVVVDKNDGANIRERVNVLFF